MEEVARLIWYFEMQPSLVRRAIREKTTLNVTVSTATHAYDSGLYKHVPDKHKVYGVEWRIDSSDLADLLRGDYPVKEGLIEAGIDIGCWRRNRFSYLKAFILYNVYGPYEGPPIRRLWKRLHNIPPLSPRKREPSDGGFQEQNRGTLYWRADYSPCPQYSGEVNRQLTDGGMDNIAQVAHRIEKLIPTFADRAASWLNMLERYAKRED